jgi:hypothetical protein
VPALRTAAIRLLNFAPSLRSRQPGEKTWTSFHCRWHLMPALSRPVRPIVQAFESLDLIAHHHRCIVRLDTPQSVATSLTVRPSPTNARTALYLCSVTLISLMRGSVTNQPK